MSKKPTITTVSSGFLSAQTINENFEAIRDHFDTLLSLDGSTPNDMEADLDLNDNDVLNGGNGYFSRVFVNGAEVGASSALNVSGFPSRNADNATSLYNSLSDGQSGFMGGLSYTRDSSKTGLNSATNDLGVNGLVPTGAQASSKHFGFVESPADCTTARQAAQTWLNSTDGALVIEKGTYLDSGTTYVLDHASLIKQGDFSGGVNLFNSARTTPLLVVVETDDVSGLDPTLSRVGVSVTNIARGSQHADGITATISNYSDDGQGNTAFYGRGHSDVLANWTAAVHGEVRHGGGTSIALSAECDPFESTGSIYGLVLNNVASGGLAAHPTTGNAKTDNDNMTAAYIQGSINDSALAGWNFGLRFAQHAMDPNGFGVRFEGPMRNLVWSGTGAVSSVADIELGADSANGIVLTGDYAGSALRIPADQKLALESTASNYLQYNSTDTQMEFVSGGNVVFAVDGNGVVGATSYSVDNYGAAGDGTTDDTTAFQSAIDALPAAGGVITLSPNRNYIVTVSSLSAGSKKILWTGGGRVNSGAVWTLPGVQESFDVTLGRVIYNKEDGGILDGSYKDNRRNADYTGGATGQLDFIERWETTVASTVGSSGNRKAEKAGVFTITQNSDHANAVALQLNAFANAQGAVWPLEVSTHSDVVPAQYAHRAAEFAISASGADTNNLRWIVDIVSHSSDSVTYDATDSVHVGVNVNAGTADMDYGVKVYDNTFNAAEIQNAAYYADTTADVFQGYGRGVAGHLKIGSDIGTASTVVSQISGQGENDISDLFTYGQIRFATGSVTDGSESGSIQLVTSTAGALTQKVQVTGDASDPFNLMVAGTLKQVTEGAADSGGAGFKVLRVVN